MKAPKKHQGNAKIFNASDEGSAIISAEISEVGGVNYGTFVTSQYCTIEQFKQVAANAGVALQFNNILPINDGSNLLVVKSVDNLEKLVEAFNQNGASLTPPDPEKPVFNAWKWRSITSCIGQGLQIASSFAAKDSSPDTVAMAGFGSLNLIANFCNWKFGSQHNPDVHQLNFLKQQFTQALAPLVEDKSKLPDVNADPTKSRIAEYPTKNLGEQLYETAQHYSTSIGEIGLRTAGSFGLAYPMNKWGAMLSHIARGDIIGAHNIGRNPNQVTYNAGLGMLLGKGVSMLAKEEDPYDPEEKNLIDNFREKIAFKLSSVIESGATAYMLADRLNMIKKPDIIGYNGQPKPAPRNEMSILGQEFNNDYLGAAGGLVFMGGYGIRFTASYGSLDVDMKHLYAHISDCLNEVPKEILPHALIATAANLKNHFADKKITFTEIYSGIANDLLHHYGVDVAMWAEVNRYNPAKMESRMNDALTENNNLAENSQPFSSINNAQQMGITAEKQSQLLV
jgi:hypothetical protein